MNCYTRPVGVVPPIPPAVGLCEYSPPGDLMNNTHLTYGWADDGRYEPKLWAHMYEPYRVVGCYITDHRTSI